LRRRVEGELRLRNTTPPSRSDAVAAAPLMSSAANGRCRPLLGAKVSEGEFPPKADVFCEDSRAEVDMACRLEVLLQKRAAPLGEQVFEQSRSKTLWNSG
jgi:hypothetical protein